jgi:hypothetical protein
MTEIGMRSEERARVFLTRILLQPKKLLQGALCGRCPTLFVAIVVAAAAYAGPVDAEQVPALLVIPPNIASSQPSLVNERTNLLKEREILHGNVIKLNDTCSAIQASDTEKVASCTALQQKLQTAMLGHIANSNAFNAAIRKLASAPQREPDGCKSDNKCIINAMNAFARREGWSAAAQYHLDRALKSLRSDGDPNATDVQVRLTWETILSRDQDDENRQRASKGDGPGYPGAGSGTQTIYEDCTIFALANATGRPYGVVAALATDLLRKGEWRSSVERANPQSIIEKIGLNGGEVILLAETLGQAEIVRSSDFAKTLRDGRPLLIAVVPQNGDVDRGHEVVLTKTFQRDGNNWFEMMDSNQGAQRRLYLSATELGTILQENGVAYRSDPGSTPTILR